MNLQKSPHPKTKPDRIATLLKAIIWVGMLIRVLNIVLLSPLYQSSSISLDPERHVVDALALSNLSPIGNLDLPIYQSWLHFVISDSRLLIGSQIMLSILTPFVWWLWMRLCLPSKRWALVGFAILTILPSWIAIFSFFMPETILLPLTGIGLWLSWLSDRRQKLALYLLSAIIWGVAVAIKTSVLGCFVAIVIWQFLRLQKSQQQNLARAILVSQCAVCLLIYSFIPWRTYQNFHVMVFTPAIQPYTELYYLSGSQTLRTNLTFKNNDECTQQTTFFIRSPCVDKQARIFAPLSNWRSSRTGEYGVDVDLRDGAHFPQIECPLTKRIELTIENWIFLYFADSSPDDVLSNGVCLSEHNMRWLWLPLTFLVILLACFSRKFTMPVTFVVTTTAIFLLQQSWVLEGRYRKPLEGLLIVAAIDLLGRKARKIDIKKPFSP